MTDSWSGASSQQSGIQIAPLVVFRPPNKRMDPETTSSEQNFLVTSEQENVLAGHIRQCWQRNKIFKEKIQLELLQCLRAKNNQYSQAELSQMQNQGGSNFVWIPLTETKTRACSAWVREILLPPGDRAWQLTPSPLPSMPIEFREAILKQATQKATASMHDQVGATGMVMSREEFRELAWEVHNQMTDDVNERAMRLAKEAAERMEDTIETTLQMGGYYEAMDSVVEDFSVFKAGILCGPVKQRRYTMEWLPGWKVGVKHDPIPTWFRIDPFDAFPAPYSVDCQTGDFIVRIRYRREQLYSMIGIPGFREDMIRECLRAYSNGHLEAWLWTEAERQRLQNETMYTFLSPWGIIDALWYWGSVPGWKLMSWGMTDRDVGEAVDPAKDYEVEAQLIGPYVIMCRLNPDPMRRRPFWKACYSAKPGAFWGHAVPELAETSQKMCNAAACAMADNLGMSSGPMVWVHTDRLADGESSVDVYPWRVWQLRSQADQGVNPGVGFFQALNYADQLQKVIDDFDRRSDDDTGIPRYTYGNDQQVGGAADTYAGLSMLMNNAAKGLRRAISNVDMNMIRPTLQMAYEWEMLYGHDQTVKGDCHIEARGAAAILVKESQRQGRLQALTLVGQNPMAMQVVGLTGYGKLLKQALRSMDGADDGVVPKDKDLQKMQEQQTQQQAEMMRQQQAAAAQQQQFIGQQNDADRQKDIQVANIHANSREKTVGAQVGAKLASEKAKQPPRGLRFEHDEKGNIVSATPFDLGAGTTEGAGTTKGAGSTGATPAARPGGGTAKPSGPKEKQP
jgi:hypothetical protein